MIRLIEAKNYRSLKYISQSLGGFHVLVGANATGKTTFLDVVSFIADLVGNGVDYAINQRTQNYMDLTFGGEGGDIELAVEVEIPEEERRLIISDKLDRIRYEVQVGLTEGTNEHAIKNERLTLLDTINQVRVQQVIVTHKGGEYEFIPEIKRPEYNSIGRIIYSRIGFKLGSKRSALGNLPADETQFPISTWLKNLLSDGLQLFILDSQNIRQASPPGKGIKFKTDGSNLPWVIEDLKKRDMDAYKNWVEHIRTALPDIQGIITVERQDDRHRYLKIIYDNGMEVPSWMVSDGTLRLLALTLPAYLPDFEGVFLIEEPENGIHPQAIEAVFQSLSSVYNAQILLATHSPVILSMVQSKDVLCFSKTTDGVTEIVKGDEHPMLKDWHGTPNLNVLFAAGVLS